MSSISYLKQEKSRLENILKRPTLTPIQQTEAKRELSLVNMNLGVSTPSQTLKVTSAPSTPTIYVQQTPTGVKPFEPKLDTVALVTEIKNEKAITYEVNKQQLTEIEKRQAEEERLRVESAKKVKLFKEAFTEETRERNLLLEKEQQRVPLIMETKRITPIKETYVPSVITRPKTQTELDLEEAERTSRRMYAESEWKRFTLPEKAYAVASSVVSQEALESILNPSIKSSGKYSDIGRVKNLKDWSKRLENMFVESQIGRISRVGEQKSLVKNWKETLKYAWEEGKKNPFTYAISLRAQSQIMDKLSSSLNKMLKKPQQYEATYLRGIYEEHLGIKGGKLPEGFDAELIIRNKDYVYGRKIMEDTYTKIVENKQQKELFNLWGKGAMVKGKGEYTTIEMFKNAKFTPEGIFFQRTPSSETILYQYDNYLRQQTLNSLRFLESEEEGFKFLNLKKWTPIKREKELNFLYKEAKDITEIKEIDFKNFYKEMDSYSPLKASDWLYYEKGTPRTYRTLEEAGIIKEAKKTTEGVLVGIRKIKQEQISLPKIATPIIGYPEENLRMKYSEINLPKIKFQEEKTEFKIRTDFRKEVKKIEEEQLKITTKIQKSGKSQSLSQQLGQIQKEIQQTKLIQKTEKKQAISYKQIEIQKTEKKQAISYKQIEIQNRKIITNLTKFQIRIITPHITILKLPDIHIPPPPTISEDKKDIKLNFEKALRESYKYPKEKKFYVPSYYALQFNIRKELSKMEREFSTGLSIRPIPITRGRRK